MSNPQPLEWLDEVLRDYALAAYKSHLSENGLKESDVAHAAAKATMATNIERENKTYLKAVIKNRATQNPDMSLQEFYDRMWPDNVRFSGATQESEKESE